LLVEGSGQVTAEGAAHLENREASINASRRADLASNGGWRVETPFLLDDLTGNLALTNQHREHKKASSNLVRRFGSL
jgi:hypothetical protein